MSISAYTIEELVGRFSSEQVDHVLVWLKGQLTPEADINQILNAYVEEMVKREGIKLSEYPKKESIAETDEEIAVEALWRILNPPPSDKEKPFEELIGGILDIIWPRWKKPPKIEVVEVEPMPPENLEVLKDLVKKAALRKLKELEEKERKKASEKKAVK